MTALFDRIHDAVTSALDGLDDEHKVELLVLVYNDLPDAMKDEFLRSAGMP